MKKDNNINIKYTLITGATGGLGNAFVWEIIKTNKHIIITSTSDDKLHTLKDTILQKDNSIDIKMCKCNFNKEEDLHNLFKYIDDNNLKIGTLINNAGYICEGSTQFSDIQTLETCIKVNNLATVFITKNILDRKKDDEHLDIITVSSLAGNYPLPYMAIYSASKAFLKSYMLAIKEEYKKKNVNILVVLPGAIATSDSMKEAINAQGFKGRLSAVEPSKIARLALKKVKKNKNVFIPGWFNKLTNIVSKITPLSLQVKVAGKMWKKSQAKRNIK